MPLTDKRIILVANTSWFIYNFKFGLVKTLMREGASVYTITENDRYLPRLEEWGCTCLTMPFFSRSTNPFQDLSILIRLYRRYREIEPSCVLQFTTKPNIYGSIASRMLGIPAVCNVPGLGAGFDHPFIRRVVRLLYRVAFTYPRHVFFLNNEDLTFFLEERLGDRGRASLVPGEGIDTEKFSPLPKTRNRDRIVFLMFSRLLWEKGLEEYREMARTVRSRHPGCLFQLLGFPVKNRRIGLTRETLKTGLPRDEVEYLGETDDVIEYIRNADCVVLPTRYREGIPRALIEAAAMARPIIASDHVGCREIVENGKNGFLFSNTLEDLIEKVEMFIGLTERERSEMGSRGREKVIRQFNEKFVTERYMQIIESLLAARKEK